MFTSFRFFILILILPLTLTPARAEDSKKEFKPGIHYTTLYKKGMHPPPMESPSESGTKKKAEKSEKEAPPSDRIWNRYKALAAGKDPDAKKEGEEGEKTLPPAPPQAPSPLKTAQPPAQPLETPKSMGLAAILEDYRKSKDQRREMKHISLSRPKAPEAPDAQKPTPPESAKP